MKHTVKFSSFSLFLTLANLALFVYIIMTLREDGPAWLMWVIVALMTAIVVGALIYMPLSVSVNDRALSVRRPLAVKRLPIADISTIQLMQPTIGEKRIIGSGGWFGYWGRFSDRVLGPYFAYYGKASDCFLVRLKDGRQYMIGCEDPGAVVDYVRARIG